LLSPVPPSALALDTAALEVPALPVVAEPLAVEAVHANVEIAALESGAHVILDTAPLPLIDDVSVIDPGARLIAFLSFLAGTIAAVTAEAAIKTKPRTDSFLNDTFCIKKDLIWLMKFVSAKTITEQI
jgi:hypothetical protein